MGDEGYYQYFNVEYNEILAPCRFAMVNKDGALINYKLGDDFVCRGFTGSGNTVMRGAFLKDATLRREFLSLLERDSR